MAGYFRFKLADDALHPDFATRLNELRIKAGFASPNDLARAMYGEFETKEGWIVPYGRDNMWRWITGRSLPQRAHLKLLCETLDCTKEDLGLGDYEPPR